MQHNLTSSIFNRFPDLVPFENLESYEAEGIAASFERFLGRQADREEIRRVLCEADQIRFKHHQLQAVIAGSSALIPRTRPGHEVGTSPEWCEPTFLGFNNWESQLIPKERKIYELTRELLDVCEEVNP